MNPTIKSFTLVYGLTADPIHKGHEQVIHNSYTFAAQNDLLISEFILVPTFKPNLIAGKKQPRTAYKHRFAMCELTATELNKKFNYQVNVSDIEKKLFKKTGLKSFSFDTLTALDKANQLFILSADHFGGRWPKFRKWYCWQELVKKHGLLIHQRPGHTVNLTFIKSLKELNPDIFLIKNLPTVDISSTNLRQKLAKSVMPDKEHINKRVLNYINSNHLYQSII
ncbi:MAG: nicotinate-nicotinamide nucleotide adenylyltransferase [Marinicella sp.]|nr:nicotinate-nicotinamide nucleotide adenylyltransferase [Xanthomonadales bacterium]